MILSSSSSSLSPSPCAEGIIPLPVLWGLGVVDSFKCGISWTVRPKIISFNWAQLPWYFVSSLCVQSPSIELGFLFYSTFSIPCTKWAKKGVWGPWIQTFQEVHYHACCLYWSKQGMSLIRKKKWWHWLSLKKGAQIIVVMCSNWLHLSPKTNDRNK